MNITNTKQRGFIALISILIMTAIMTLLALGMSERSLASSQTGSDQERGEQALTMATNCAEHALLQFKLDALYEGNETFTVGDNTCKIYALEADGSGGKFMKTESTVSLYTRRVLVDATRSGSSTEVILWQNVAHF